MLNFKSPKALVFALIIIYNLLAASTVSSQGQLQVGFYSKTCPNAESIVSSVTQKTFERDPGSAAVLLRLQFHDCYVEVFFFFFSVARAQTHTHNSEGFLLIYCLFRAVTHQY